MENLTCAHVLISGKVQGVYYRGATAEMAQQLGVQGWVRNLPDRRVEAMFAGPPEAVAAIITWCHQGPPAARVEKVVVEDVQPESFSGFEVR